MTDETAPAAVEAPHTADREGATDGGSGSAAAGAARRRRRRGGRGRGGRGPGGAVRAAAAEQSAAGDPEIDVDAQPGETERISSATIDEAPTGGDGAAPSATRSRRSRGGRGRGGGGRPRSTSGPATSEEATAASGSRTKAEPADGPIEEAEVVSAPPDGSAPRKGRRRGGRGRGRKKPPGTEGEAAPASEEDDAAPTPRASRSRSRTTSSTASAAKAAPARSRQPRAAKAREPKATKAKEAAGSNAAEAPTSTRLKRQRVSRQVRRRRDVMPSVERITDKLMAITEHGERDQIAVLEGRDLVQHYVTRQGAHSMVGNVYLGRVQNVLPGMEAAFVDVGRGRNAVLYAGEVNWSIEDLEGAPPRIEHVLKSGQSVLVQVTKDPIGGKGARLTAQISLPGRYLVLAPNSNVTGISRRLSDTERRRLKAIYKQLKPGPHGLIVRTAAEGASEEALAVDLNRLIEEWNAIEKRAKKAKAPDVLYEEPELTLRVVRDLFTDEEYRELVTDSPRIFRLIADYLRDVAPDLLAKVRLHEGALPAFEEFHIVEQIHKGLDRKVWLPSGGYIVIERTEALTVIDVNTGKAVGKTNLEETVVNTNVEAAREAARQMRLRDIGGMIVIDFIDMLLEQNKSRVIDAMKEALAQDKSRSQVFDISPLGLLEVTRKRVSGGLLDAFSETCPTCEGRGVILTYDVN